MDAVKPRMPIKAAHINNINAALEGLSAFCDIRNAQGAARDSFYFAMPGFTGSACADIVSVYPGQIFINGRMVTGSNPANAFIDCSLSNYADARTHALVPGVQAWIVGTFRTSGGSTTVQGTTNVDSAADADFRLVWTTGEQPPEQTAPEEGFQNYRLRILTVKANASGFLYIHQHFLGSIHINTADEPTTGGEGGTIPLAQYFAPSKQDTPGKIAGIQRIPVAEWIQQGTTSVTGAWTGPTSGIERIVDGVIYLKEPREYVAANFNNSLVQDNIGLIASVVFDQPRGTATIADGVMHLPSSVETPPAQFRPATYNGSPQNSTCVMGSVQSMTATSSVDGIPRMIDGNIYLPAANFNSTDHGTTPGYINGIAFTSGVDAPFIHEGFIHFPEPTASNDYPFGLYLSSGATVDLDVCVESTLYRLSSHDQQRSANAAVLASATYAQVTHGSHATYLRIFTLTANEYCEDAAGLDNIAQGLTGTSSILR